MIAHPDVWVTRRIDIARHWAAQHPPGAPAAGPTPERTVP
jgi:allantoinase